MKLNNNKKTVIALFGPTAVGKTQLAMEVSEALGCPLISVDSAMVYRGMDIGTSKPDAATLARYPHDLVSIRAFTDFYSVQDFVADATVKINAYHAEGKTPLLVGGTMLYFHALQQGLSDMPATSVEIRAQLQQRLEHEGLTALYIQLQQCDPRRAAAIHPNDTQRILRALEVFTATGTPMSTFLEGARQFSDWDWVNVALVPADRSVLHHNIGLRWQKMIAEGLIAEVEALQAMPGFDYNLPAMRSVGYRQILAYLAGHCTEQERDVAACAATRQLAKRQLTWMNQWHSCYSIKVELTDLPIKYVQSLLQSKIAE